jgi:sulfotransferase family protein
MSSGLRPNLFILGAPRCGTTAMWTFLGAHPEIFAPWFKEPGYFIPGERRPGAKTREEYLGLFADAGQERWLLEGSTYYLSTPAAPALIREFSPEARAIVMVNPADQISSHYDFRRFYLEEPHDIRSALEGPDAEQRYVRYARYGEQLERVLEVFPRTAVHIVVYDDFLTDNEAEYRRVLEFLDVHTGFTPSLDRVGPSLSGYRSYGLQRLLFSDQGTVRAASRVLVPRSLRRTAWQTAHRLNRRRGRSRLEPELAGLVWRRLERDVERLSALLDRDLVALWRP